MDIFEQVAEMKRQEGRQEGLEEGLEKGVRVMLANTELSVKKIASVFGVSVAFARKIAKEVRTK
jgi:predicted transposase YdaD